MSSDAGSEVEEAVISDSEVEEAFISGSELEEAAISGSELEEAFISCSEVEEAAISGSAAEEAAISGSAAEEAAILGSAAEEAAISGSEEEEAVISGSEEEEAAISGSAAEEADISGSEEDTASTSSEPTIITFIEDNLWKVLECPQCKNTMFEPIFFCMSGHSFCNDCCGYLKSCNICSADITSHRNEYAEKLSHILQDKCRFSKYGCKDKVDKKDREEHEDMCDFETFACEAGRGNVLKVKECCWRGKKTALLKHVEDVHGDRYLCDEQPIGPLTLSTDDDLATYLISAIGELFWLTVKLDSRRGKRFEAVQYIGSIIKARNFQYKHELKYVEGTTFLTFFTRTMSCFEDIDKAIASNMCFAFNSRLFSKLFLDYGAPKNNSYKLTIEKITEEMKET